jgi:hypothetical protein
MLRFPKMDVRQDHRPTEAIARLQKSSVASKQNVRLDFSCGSIMFIFILFLFMFILIFI